MKNTRILSLFLHIDVNQYNNFEEFDELKDLLHRHGIELDFNMKENILSVIVNERILSRDAGRQKKFAHEKEIVNKNGIHEEVKLLKLSDVEKLQKKMTDEQIVSKLNISRSTFYRHLKKAKEKRTETYDPYF